MARTGVVSVMCLGACVVSAAQAQCPVDFDPLSTPRVGTSPYSIVVMDLNGDGRKDIASANFNSRSVVIRLAAAPPFPPGSDMFQPAVSYDVVGNPVSITSGDFNHDGRPDLAVALLTLTRVSVLIANASGGFNTPASYNVGLNPQSIATGDFNNDGNLDLVTANTGVNSASLLLGNANGTFGTASSIPMGTQPVFVLAHDFNGDSALDIATANFESGNISVRLGNNNGTFQAASTYAVGLGPASIVAGDFDGDGVADLAVANNGGLIATEGLSLLRGLPNGQFGANEFYRAGASGPASVTTGDFNSDGSLDLVVANYGGQVVSILRGNGTSANTFQLPQLLSAGVQPRFVVATDLDGDSRPDLAVANRGSDDVSILLNVTPECPPLCAGDFNADGAVNSQDYFDFITAFFALNGAADFNHDTFINSQDYFDFLGAFFGGC